MDEITKLKKFQDSVFAEVDMKSDEIRKEAEKYKEEQLEKNKDEQLLNAYNIIQKSSQEIKSRHKRDTAKFSLDSKRNVLKRRNELVDSIFNDVSDKITSYLATDEYEKYLCKSLKAFSDKYHIENADIYVRDEDIKLSDKLKAAYSLPCKIVSSNGIALGGFILESKTLSLYYDETIKTKLDEQKKHFIQNSEFSL